MAGVAAHFHWEIPFVPAAVGVNTAVTAVPSIVPPAVTTPSVAPTLKLVTYLVEVKELPQVSRLEKPEDCTISVTQVRALEAAKTTSDILAFAV